MTTEWLIAALTVLLSVVSVILSGFFAVRTTRLSHKLDAERARAMEEESAIRAAERVYEPLAMAAAELQSRLYNIVETGWVPLMKRYESHGDYALTSTAFLFAHYFGWIEARRQAVLSSSGEGRRDEEVQHLIDGVLKILRRSDDSEGFLFFTTEQRAIGELMCTWEVNPVTGARTPQVMGYAAFEHRFHKKSEFAKWFGPVHTGMALVSAGDVRRLVAIQHALVRLIDTLDPKRRYTAGFDLREIDLSDNPPPA
jgi:hypothetical protein